MTSYIFKSCCGLLLESYHNSELCQETRLLKPSTVMWIQFLRGLTFVGHPVWAVACSRTHYLGLRQKANSIPRESLTLPYWQHSECQMPSVCTCFDSSLTGYSLFRPLVRWNDKLYLMNVTWDIISILGVPVISFSGMLYEKWRIMTKAMSACK